MNWTLDQQTYFYQLTRRRDQQSYDHLFEPQPGVCVKLQAPKDKTWRIGFDFCALGVGFSCTMNKFLCKAMNISSKWLAVVAVSHPRCHFHIYNNSEEWPDDLLGESCLSPGLAEFNRALLITTCPEFVFQSCVDLFSNPYILVELNQNFGVDFEEIRSNVKYQISLFDWKLIGHLRTPDKANFVLQIDGTDAILLKRSSAQLIFASPLPWNPDITASDVRAHIQNIYSWSVLGEQSPFVDFYQEKLAKHMRCCILPLTTELLSMKPVFHLWTSY